MGESVEAGPFVHDNPLDIEQIYSKAQNQWLSRPEMCRILQNPKGFPITSAPENKPPSGSLFLFNKKKQRYFRNDGHNWTKKKDGKTISEGHRLFKVEGYGDLDCYYACGKENRNFRRRCYWMPERDFSHIVLVHYLEDTGNSEDFSCVEEAQVACPYSQGQESVESIPNSKIDSSRCPGSHPNNCQGLSVSEYTDKALLPHGAQALEHENAQSEYNHQASSGVHFDLEFQQHAAEKIEAGGSYPHVPPFNPTIPEIDLAPTQSDKDKSDNDAEATDYSLLESIKFELLKDDSESCPCSESMEDQSLSSFSHPKTVDEFLNARFVRVLDFKEHSQIRAESKVHPDIRNDNFVASGANSEKVENENEILSSSFEEQLEFFIRGPSLSQEKLDEQSLGVPISSINLDNQDDVGTGPNAVQNISEISTTARSLGNPSDGLQPGKGMNDDDSGLPYESQEFLGQPEMQEECQMQRNVRMDYPMENGCQTQLSNRVDDYVLPNDSVGYLNMEGKSIYPPAIGQDLSDVSLTEEGLKKIDSFIPGMSEVGEEIGDVTELDESRIQYRAGVNRETVWNRDGIAGYLADRSLDVHIPSINLDHQDDSAGPKAVQKISEISAAPLSLGNASDCQSRMELSAARLRSSSESWPNIPLPGLVNVGPGIVKDSIGVSRVYSVSDEEDDEDEEGPDDEGPDDEAPEKDDEAPEKDEGPEKEKEKEEGKKRAPDSAWESGRANKILKAYLAYMALLTAYYNVQSMETILMLVLVCVEASKKSAERKLSYTDDGFELSAIRE